MKKLLIIGVTLLAMLTMMVGCTETGTSAGPSIDSITAEIMSQDTTDNQTAGTGMMSVRVDIGVSNFTAVGTIGETATDNATDGGGDGYYVFYMDRLPDILQEQMPGLVMTEGEQAYASTDTSYTWENVERGIHVFSVQLVDAEGMPLSSPVVAAAALTVLEATMEGGATTTTTATGAPPVLPTTEAPTTEAPTTEAPTTEAPTTEAPTTEAGTVEPITVDLAIDDISFDMTEIVVPAGAEITVNLQNNGANAHSFSVYESTDGTGPVYVGTMVMAGETGTFTFTAPSEPGTYYFIDDEDPLMGSHMFIVE